MIKYLKIFSSIICTISLLAIAILSVSGEESSYSRGDVNGDSIVDISDATGIQKYICKIVELTDTGKKAGDINFDNEVNIQDTTILQKILAGALYDAELSPTESTTTATKPTTNKDAISLPYVPVN